MWINLFTALCTYMSLELISLLNFCFNLKYPAVTLIKFDTGRDLVFNTCGEGCVGILMTNPA